MDSVVSVTERSNLCVYNIEPVECGEISTIIANHTVNICTNVRMELVHW